MYLIGQSEDVHLLMEKQPLILGGITIDSSIGTKAHSDGDVLLHTITEAILGTIQAGDLGDHFPNNDNNIKGISSKIMLKYALQLLKEKNYQLVNIDCLICLELVSLKKWKKIIKASIMKLTNCSLINVKATTYEGVGIIGQGYAIKAQTVVLVKKIKEG